MLRPGDTVSIEIAPTLQVAKFTFIKASARVSRTLGDDVESDLAKLQADVREVYARTVATELGVMNELSEALGEDGDIDRVCAWATRVADGSEEEDREEEDRVASRRVATRRTAVRKKTRRKASKRRAT
tara:strand:- start:1891 stop:2277 length:387 start_codon:yes stop_codon:yes gene_type:complete